MSTTDHTTTGTDGPDLFPVSEADLSALGGRLARAAEREGVLDVAYRTVDSPLGEILVAATVRGTVRVAFAREGFDAVLDALAQRISPRILRAPARLDPLARELEEYFAGRRRRFEAPVDLALSSGFRLAVQRYLPRIAYGGTATYRDVAEQVGSPRAVRAVGTACATNPLPILLPCHRVLRSDGGLGGYLGGLDAKAALLELEGAGADPATS